MSSEGFTELLEVARLASNEVCDRATLILRRTLPDNHALQQVGSIFSPRLMVLMCGRAEGKLSEPDRQLLVSALRYAEEEQLTRMGRVLAVTNDESALDIPGWSSECGEAIAILRRMSAELDGVLQRVRSS